MSNLPHHTNSFSNDSNYPNEGQSARPAIPTVGSPLDCFLRGAGINQPSTSQAPSFHGYYNVPQYHNRVPVPQQQFASNPVNPWNGQFQHTVSQGTSVSTIPPHPANGINSCNPAAPAYPSHIRGQQFPGFADATNSHPPLSTLPTLPPSPHLTVPSHPIAHGNREQTNNLDIVLVTGEEIRRRQRNKDLSRIRKGKSRADPGLSGSSSQPPRKRKREESLEDVPSSSNSTSSSSGSRPGPSKRVRTLEQPEESFLPAGQAVPPVLRPSIGVPAGVIPFAQVSPSVGPSLPYPTALSLSLGYHPLNGLSVPGLEHQILHPEEIMSLRELEDPRTQHLGVHQISSTFIFGMLLQDVQRAAARFGLPLPGRFYQQVVERERVLLRTSASLMAAFYVRVYAAEVQWAALQLGREVPPQMRRAIIGGHPFLQRWLLNAYNGARYQNSKPSQPIFAPRSHVAEDESIPDPSPVGVPPFVPAQVGVLAPSPGLSYVDEDVAAIPNPSQVEAPTLVPSPSAPLQAPVPSPRSRPVVSPPVGVSEGPTRSPSPGLSYVDEGEPVPNPAQVDVWTFAASPPAPSSPVLIPLPLSPPPLSPPRFDDCPEFEWDLCGAYPVL